MAVLVLADHDNAHLRDTTAKTVAAAKTMVTHRLARAGGIPRGGIGRECRSH